MNAGWAHFEHEADVGVRGIGASMAQAFEQTALALTAVICAPDAVRPIQEVTITCAGSDPELLLADWLNAVIYEMAVRRMLFSRFDVQIEGAELRASAWGEAIEPERHRPAVEVKGATYTMLHVGCEDGIWIAQTVIDV